MSGNSRRPLSLSVTEAARPNSVERGGDWAKTLRGGLTGGNHGSEGVSGSLELEGGRPLSTVIKEGGRPLSTVIKEKAPAKEEMSRRVTVTILEIRNLPEDLTVESYSGGGALGKEEVFCKMDLRGEKTKTTKGVSAYAQPGEDNIKFPQRETVYYLAGSDVKDLTITVSGRRVLAGVNGPEWSVGHTKFHQLGKTLYEDKSSTLWLPLSPSPGGPLDEEVRYNHGRDREPVVTPEVMFKPVDGTPKRVFAHLIHGIVRVCALTQ